MEMVEGKQEKEEGLRVWEKVVRSWQRKHGQNRGSTVVLRSTGLPCQNSGKIILGQRWHDHPRGHGQAVPNFWLARVSVSAFFMEFLGCVLVGDCAWAILGVFMD